MNAEFVLEGMKSIAGDCFCENVSYWSAEGMCFTTRWPWRTFSWTKYRSSSTCFVSACCMVFSNNITVLRLSHHTIWDLDRGNFSPERTEDIKVNSATRWARLLYSALVLDLDTTCCLFDCQCTRTIWVFFDFGNPFTTYLFSCSRVVG